MKPTTKWFWAIVAAQAAFLLAWAGYHEVVRQTAPVLLLKGRPVDPQDLLRGDYMTMRYDIGTATVETGPAAKPGSGDSAGSEVWVLLEPRDGYHVVAKASREPLRAGPGQVLVRGALGYDWRSGARDAQIDYGIERYFVPEGKGSPRFQKVEVEVSVSPAHRLSIKRVLLDGKAYP
ncbi:MAG: GDYXXLXY domain-containing protein [Verrucomicrobia bacterium]|nr:GDYXXLXY domain-containing protein [Verrucomicrobiota bacterium]